MNTHLKLENILIEYSNKFCKDDHPDIETFKEFRNKILEILNMIGKAKIPEIPMVIRREDVIVPSMSLLMSLFGLGIYDYQIAVGRGQEFRSVKEHFDKVLVELRKISEYCEKIIDLIERSIKNKKNIGYKDIVRGHLKDALKSLSSNPRRSKDIVETVKAMIDIARVLKIDLDRIARESAESFYEKDRYMEIYNQLRESVYSAKKHLFYVFGLVEDLLRTLTVERMTLRYFIVGSLAVEEVYLVPLFSLPPKKALLILTLHYMELDAQANIQSSEKRAKRYLKEALDKYSEILEFLKKFLDISYAEKDRTLRVKEMINTMENRIKKFREAIQRWTPPKLQGKYYRIGIIKREDDFSFGIRPDDSAKKIIEKELYGRWHNKILDDLLEMKTNVYLLIGPPGWGKTTLAWKLADKLGDVIVYFGEGRKLQEGGLLKLMSYVVKFKRAFDKLRRKNTKVCVIVDDCEDVFAGTNRSDLLKILASFRGLEVSADASDILKNVYLILTSNSSETWELLRRDPAIGQRLIGVVVYPADDERRDVLAEILKGYLRERGITGDYKFISNVVEEFINMRWSIRDLVNILKMKKDMRSLEDFKEALEKYKRNYARGLSMSNQKVPELLYT